MEFIHRHPALTLVAALALCAGIGAGAIAAIDTGDSTPAPPASSGPTAASTLPKPTAGRAAPSNVLELPRVGYPVVYVRHGSHVEIRTRPRGGKLVKTVGAHTEFGSPTVFSVVRTSGRWAGVDTPYLANRQLGWLKLDRRRLGTYASRDAIRIDVSARRGELVRAGRLVRAFTVTVGAYSSPTPVGRFAVTDTFRGNLDAAAYGCCALALTARQPNLPSGWLGGSRIAIHGTYGTVGLAESHGCIRAENADVSALVRHVPIGSPVFIQE